MARLTKKREPIKAVYVFWEGESEEAYTKFIRQRYLKKAGIQAHREKGTFATASAYFRGNQSFKETVKELDELWFFFDTEVEKGQQWKDSMNLLAEIKKSRRKNPITIRLLMTSCCIEYWFLLHYKKTAPSMATPADKERILEELKKQVPFYKKGDQEATNQIAQNYPTAIQNGKWTLERLKDDGMPDAGAGRDEWLFSGTHTFTTVHEALEWLESLTTLQASGGSQ